MFNHETVILWAWTKIQGKLSQIFIFLNDLLNIFFQLVLFKLFKTKQINHK